jgi:transcriptional regulator with XRE-family HTH domain
LSQEQFAERSGFTQQYLSDLERGLRNPTIVSIYELAQALGVEHVVLVAPDDDALKETLRRRKSEAHESSIAKKSKAIRRVEGGSARGRKA